MFHICAAGRANVAASGGVAGSQAGLWGCPRGGAGLGGRRPAGPMVTGSAEGYPGHGVRRDNTLILNIEKSIVDIYTSLWGL